MQMAAAQGICQIDDFIDVLENYKGAMSVTCIHCNAKRWVGKKSSLCCHNGKTKNVPLPQIHPDLADLFEGESQQSKHFLKCIQKYNQVFALTSLQSGAIDQNLASMRDGVYTLRINGGMYHSIGMEVVAQHPEQSKFAQIYMLDDNMQTNRRMEIFGNELNAEVMNCIHTILHAENILIQSFKTAREVLGDNITNMRLQITGEVPMGEHERRYNAPTTNGHIGGIILDNEDLNAGSTNIVLHQQSGGLKRISMINPSYDAFSYPLLFIDGAQGWSKDFKEENGVTLKAFAQFQLQRRTNISIIHQSGKLFQQWIIDQYIRVEANNLMYLRLNQDKIRAECYQNI